MTEAIDPQVSLEAGSETGAREPLSSPETNPTKVEAAVESGPIVKEGSPERTAELLKKASGQISTTTSDEVRDDARNTSLLADIESQVNQLTALAQTKGVVHAVKVAEKMRNYYLLDRLHDELVDKFEEALEKKGLMVS